MTLKLQKPNISNQNPMPRWHYKGLAKGQAQKLEPYPNEPTGRYTYKYILSPKKKNQNQA